MHTSFARLARMAFNDVISKRNCWRLRKSVYVYQDIIAIRIMWELKKKILLNLILHFKYETAKIHIKDNS